MTLAASSVAHSRAAHLLGFMSLGSYVRPRLDSHERQVNVQRQQETLQADEHVLETIIAARNFDRHPVRYHGDNSVRDHGASTSIFVMRRVRTSSRIPA